MKIQRSKRRMTPLDESWRITPAKIHSRKRQKSSRPSPNPNPLATVFTRSRSRIFSHQNRSGFSRPNPIARKPVPTMESFLDVNCISAQRALLTKDLRHKRVFSPVVNSIEEKNEEQSNLLKGFAPSTVPDVDDANDFELGKSEIDGVNDLKLKDQTIPGNASPPKLKKGINGCQTRKVFKTPNSFSYKRLLPHLMDIVNDSSSVSTFELVDAGTKSMFPKLDGVGFESRSIAENSCAVKTECVAPRFNDLRKVSTVKLNLSGADDELDQTAEAIWPLEVKEEGRQSDVNGVDASVEERIQTTPPDPCILAKTEVGCGRESSDAKKDQTFIVGCEKSNNGSLKRCPNTKDGDNLMDKAALNPCSRLKFFRNSRSVSYRRLLPFLMDISKADSCTAAKLPKKLHQVVSEEDRQPAPSATAQRCFVNNNLKEKTCERMHDEARIQTAADGSPPDSNSNLRSVNSATLPDLGTVTEETGQSQSGLAKLPLDLGSKESSLVSEPSSVFSCIQTKQHTPEEPRSAEKHDTCLSVGLELHSGNTDSSEIVNLKQPSSPINTLDHLGALVSPNNKPFKGILKRNRPGCRGLCDCLNCASFRLHAERAFEFSRNQLHDAEEVASQLMKELANVRLLLEKSIAGKDDSASIRPNTAIIKEACDRTIEAETLAKERLGELNNELTVHCRIPVMLQPKVTFALNNQ
ncbi:hypothetical protein SASPL_116319 [Salvia splendens]|uniref:Uncharacterized protein n=1 Tax=Salvia splendens TaxID=180675 RepID=A0A8X8ZVA4_SALSN|nr:uncharacterized protein LOC121809858 [Salvia splendens]KAG6419807.1 hypothetical protein SASPL_116319 [Salvia splendens]